MDASWVTAGIAACGIVGQLAIGMKNSGAADERSKTHGREIRELKDTTADHGKQLADHAGKIVRLETLVGSGD